jgi:hypothetical protein
VADLYRRGDQVEALVLDYDPASPTTLQIGSKEVRLKEVWLTVTPVELTAKPVN